MKRIISLLLPLLLLLAACASGGDGLAPDDVAAPGAESAAPGAESAAPTEVAATDAPSATDEAPADEPAADEAATTTSPDDPTLARERDWKLGDLTDPAVTIIEYGDFQ